MFGTRKLLLVAFALIAFVTISHTAKANAAGGELIYRWVNGSTYRFFFKLYRDCSGTAAPSSFTLCATNPCNPSSNFSSTMQLWPGLINGSIPNGTPLSAACPGTLTKCQNPASPVQNYEEWWYSADVTLPFNCNAWKFTVLVSPRASSNNLASSNMYVEVVYNSLAFPANSSPFFSVRPIPNICINQPYTFNNGAGDADNDSLITEIINPLTSSSCLTAPSNVSFNAASPSFSIPGNPIQTGNSFSIDAATGKMNYTPTQAGPATLMVKTSEYRNGQLVGSMMRDFRVNVSNACNNNPVPALNIKTITNGVYSGGVVYTCKELSLNFCFDITSSTGTVLNAAANTNAFSSAATTFFNQDKDSVRGCFSFTTSAADSGMKSLVVVVRDSSCAAPGMVYYYTYTIPVVVWGRVTALSYSAICPGGSAALKAVNGANFLWSVLPGGSSLLSLSCANCPNPIATPSVTTTYRVTANLTACPVIDDTVTVHVYNAPLFTPINNIIACPKTLIPLNLNPTPQPGEVYSYQWLPNSFLSSNTIPNPVSSANNNIKYTVTISTANGCKAYDTVDIDVLDGFNISNNDSTICVGQSMKIKGVNDTRYTYQWTTTSPSSTITSPNQFDPVIEQKERGKFVYKIVASYPGCVDSTDSLSITAQPYPSIELTDEERICRYDSVQFAASITPLDFTFKYKWTPATDLSNDSVLTPYFYGSNVGTFPHRLIASTSAGCSDTAEVSVKVSSPTEFLQLLSTDTTICPPDSVQLHVAGNGLSKVSWFPGLSMDDTSSFNPYVFPGVNTTYYVRGVDSNGCADSLGVTIKAKPAGVVHLPDTVRIYPGESYRMDPEGNCLYFKWSTYNYMDRGGVANPIVTPPQSIQYIAYGTTEYGCTGNDTINVVVLDNSVMGVPNAFTPGGSKLNAVVKSVYRGRVQLKYFAIYNRWGNKVFETKDINEGWDGTFNGVLQPQGVFIYTIEATLDKETPFIKQGNITLIR